jgi:prophage regulatory protein
MGRRKLASYIMSLPEIGYVRLWQIIGCSKRGIAPVIPVGRATWWNGVKSGRYPAGKLLSPGVRVWDVADIRGLLK